MPGAGGKLNAHLVIAVAGGPALMQAQHPGEIVDLRGILRAGHDIGALIKDRLNVVVLVRVDARDVDAQHAVLDGERVEPERIALGIGQIGVAEQRKAAVVDPVTALHVGRPQPAGAVVEVQIRAGPVELLVDDEPVIVKIDGHAGTPRGSSDWLPVVCNHAVLTRIHNAQVRFVALCCRSSTPFRAALGADDAQGSSRARRSGAVWRRRMHRRRRAAGPGRATHE